MSTDGKVLVTGAGGFIGGRVVEVLAQGQPHRIRPSIRRWSTAARIGRLPLDPVQCDLMEPSQISAALEGVDSIIHCAVGDRASTVKGTRNLLAAARDHAVRRVVHLSTIDVYGRATGTVTEDHPLVRTGREYGDSKIEAEDVCQEFASQGLDVVILRPTIVYGPFSDLWTLEFAERFRDRTWLLPKKLCQGRCNLVYVDDLVQAILLAINASGVRGEAFNVNGPDNITWQEYFEALNAALGLPSLPSPPESASRMRSLATAPIRSAAKATFKRFENPILHLYKRSRAARSLMKWVESTLRRTPSFQEFDLYGRVAHFPAGKAEKQLGYRPVVPVDDGVHLSAQWLAHVGVVDLDVT